MCVKQLSDGFAKYPPWHLHGYILSPLKSMRIKWQITEHNTATAITEFYTQHNALIVMSNFWLSLLRVIRKYFFDSVLIIDYNRILIDYIARQLIIKILYMN